MSEEYNPQADLIEGIERLEVELKDLLCKRDQMKDAKSREVIEQQIADRKAELKKLQARLV